MGTENTDFQTTELGAREYENLAISHPRIVSTTSRGQAANPIHSLCDDQGRIIMVQFSDPFVAIINDHERSPNHPG
jgi:hypothetical protein